MERVGVKSDLDTQREGGGREGWREGKRKR